MCSHFSTGTVIYCAANGNPTPKISWEMKNDQVITELTGKCFGGFIKLIFYVVDFLNKKNFFLI